MQILLTKAIQADAQELYHLQIKCFRAMLEKYQDVNSNPGAEKLEDIVQRMREPSTHDYFITLTQKHIGAIRIRDFKELCILWQIGILPEYQGNGYAQQAIKAVELLYPNAKEWQLDTIVQEEKLCCLYEKMDYHKTGKSEHIKDGMDLAVYAKQL